MSLKFFNKIFRNLSKFFTNFSQNTATFLIYSNVLHLTKKLKIKKFFIFLKIIFKFSKTIFKFSKKISKFTKNLLK